MGLGGDGSIRADPGGLPDTLQEAVRALRNAVAGRGPQAAWPTAVAENLMEYAGPVFAGIRRVEPEKASAIRLAALCLAGEADSLGDPGRTDIGEMFRQIAAGVTIVQSWTSPMILLAVE